MVRRELEKEMDDPDEEETKVREDKTMEQDLMKVKEAEG